MPSTLRPSVYGALLRTPEDPVPRLWGSNNWVGQNTFETLYVQNLYVTQNLEIRDPDVDISAASASRLGTKDNQDFRLKSNDVDRLQLTSGGVIVFSSAILTAGGWNQIVTSYSDNFNRADENPVAGWTSAAGTVQSFVSGNVLYCSSTGVGGAVSSIAYLTAEAAAPDWDVQVDCVALTAGTSADGGQFQGVVARLLTGGSGYYWLRNTRNVGFNAGYYLKGLNPGTAISSVNDNNASAGHTLRLVLSATSAIAYVDGAFKTSSLVSSYDGFAGFSQRGVGNSNTSAALDNWQANQTSAIDLPPEDLVFAPSAVLWTHGTTANKVIQWAQLYSGQAILGLRSDILVSSQSNKYFQVAEGTSAIFPATTYGVTRLLSAAGTVGLSGVIGLSGVGLTISAVGNDITISAADAPSTSASATFIYGGTSAAGDLVIRGVTLASAVASANLPAASATRSGAFVVDLTASALIIYVGAARMSAAFTAF